MTLKKNRYHSPGCGAEHYDEVCTCDLHDRIASLESQLAASQAALRKYGRHGVCASVGHLPGERRVPTGKSCSCGLDAALHALPERPTGRCTCDVGAIDVELTPGCPAHDQRPAGGDR